MTDEHGPRVADGGRDATDGEGSARYVFRVRFHLEPETPDVHLEPRSFETVLFREADPPGTDGWLFFRDNLWRGEVGDEGHLRELASDSLGVPVDAVSFREFQTDEAHLDDLKAVIADDLDLFNADATSEVLSKYLGSSIRVVEDDEF